MNTDLLQSPPYLAKILGLSLDDLLRPVEEERPSGEDLRGSPLFREIQEARRADDPTLPQGPWERDLKKADWEKVAVLTRDAIARRSKDLQLAAWMAEVESVCPVSSAPKEETTSNNGWLTTGRGTSP